MHPLYTFFWGEKRSRDRYHENVIILYRIRQKLWYLVDPSFLSEVTDDCKISFQIYGAEYVNVFGDTHIDGLLLGSDEDSS